MSSASRLLLDTHIFLWWRGEPSRLDGQVRDRIATAPYGVEILWA